MRTHSSWVMAALLASLAGAPISSQQQREPRPVRPAPVVVQPLVVRQVEPEYTAEALKARIAGDVHVAAVVRADGTVAAAEVIKSLDPQLGLDERALDAVRQWRFQPGTLDGKPVPFTVTLVLEFRVRERSDVIPAGSASVHVIALTPRQAVPATIVTAGAAPQDQTRIYRTEPGVSPPVPLHKVTPTFPVEAEQGRITGTVVLDAVVRPDGTVAETRVTTTQGYHLDRAATEAVEKWRFTPGRVGGRPVPVWVTIEMEFRLADNSPASVIPTIALPSAPASSTDRSAVSREEFGREAYPDNTIGLRKPRVLSTRPARYTFAAMRAKLQGAVEVDVVVQADGSVGRARIAKGLRPSLGLDDQALVAVRDWRFAPGEIDGRPVPVVTTVVVEFRLH